MNNFVTAQIKISADTPEYLKEFFSLDAEFISGCIDDFQVISFSKETNICVVEIFIGKIQREEFLSSLFTNKISLSVDNYSIDYEIINVE